MHDKHAPILKAICSSAAPPARRLPYSPPALRLYGKVKHMTEGSGGMGNDGGGLMTKMSDRNTKENIVKIGEHPLGIGLYLFDYRAEFRDAGGHGRHLGVMADEVERVRPAAVSLHPNGHKVVNYGLLN